MVIKAIKKHRISNVKKLPTNFSVVVPSEISRRGLISILKSITDLPVHYYSEHETIQNLLRSNIPYIVENISENTSIREKNHSFIFHMHKMRNNYQTGWDEVYTDYQSHNPVITWDEFINGTYVG